MNIKEIRDLSEEEIASRKRKLREEAFHLRIKQQSGQLENPSELRSIRRDVARLNTVVTERGFAPTTPKNEL